MLTRIWCWLFPKRCIHCGQRYPPKKMCGGRKYHRWRRSLLYRFRLMEGEDGKLITLRLPDDLGENLKALAREQAFPLNVRRRAEST